MRIFHVITHADLGGAPSIVINLVKESVRDGHEVFVLSELNGPMWAELPDQVIKIPIKSLQHHIHPLKDLRVLFFLRKQYRKFNPDIIHLHSSKIGALGRLAFPSSKIIYTVHGFDSMRVAHRKFLIVEKVLKNLAAHIVGVSRYDFENLRAEGIRQNSCCIYNGIIDWPSVAGIDELDTDIADQFARAKDLGYFIVLCISRLKAPKRFDLFCEVAECLTDKKVKFFWIGNQEKPSAPLPDHVICLGEVKNAHRFIKYADLCMLTSNYEGMPVFIIESLAYGKTVIASKVGGVPEVLNGSNGYALNNNKEEFIERILYYYQHHDALLRSNIAARESYERNFTVSRMYKSYLELYEQCNLKNTH